MQALQALLAAVPGATVLPALRRGNVVGALQLGMRPAQGGLDARGALQAAADGKIECLVLVGADPLADFPDADLARRAHRRRAPDHRRRHVPHRDQLARPTSCWRRRRTASKAGTTTNLEGRVSTLSQKVTPRGTSRPDWMIAAELARLLGTEFGYTSVDDVTAAIAAIGDRVRRVSRSTALRTSRDGVLAAAPTSIDPIDTTVSASLPDRNSYDFRLVVSRKLYDQAVGTANSPSLAHLAPGFAAHVHPLDIERASVVAGAEVKLSSARASIVVTRRSPTRRCYAARCGCRSTSRAAPSAN